MTLVADSHGDVCILSLVQTQVKTCPHMLLLLDGCVVQKSIQSGSQGERLSSCMCDESQILQLGLEKRPANAFKEQNNTFNTTMLLNVALEHRLMAASSCNDNMTGIMRCLSTIQPIV